MSTRTAPTPGPAPATLAAHWSLLATTALLGADRRPVAGAPPGVIAEALSGRRRDSGAGADSHDGAIDLLDQIAALTLLRRAGVRPQRGGPLLVPPPADPRPPCPSGAVDRLVAIASEWPVLMDEWFRLAAAGGWRLAGDHAALLLTRLRGFPQYRAALRGLSGELMDWLVGLFPAELGAPKRTQKSQPADVVSPERPSSINVTAIPAGIDSGELTTRHRPLLVHAIAGCEPTSLANLGEGLSRAGQRPETMGLALGLADLARTRLAMIQELARD